MCDLKDYLVKGKVTSNDWLPTGDMWVDTLTKDMSLTDGLKINLLEVADLNLFHLFLKYQLMYSLS